MIRNTKIVSVDEVQGYLAKGAKVHPLLYSVFIEHLIRLEFDKKLTILPKTRLEIYSRRVSANIARKLAA